MFPRVAFVLCLLFALFGLAAPVHAEEHEVQKGQTLGAIARRYNVSVDDLCKANKISRRTPIKPGQKLIIPGTGGGKPKPKPAPAERAKPDRKGTVHEVGKGQTLGGIAHRYDITVDELCKANKISPRDPIRPGQELVIPGTDGRTPKPKASPGDTEDKSKRRDRNAMQTIPVRGAPPAYYWEPTGRGRLGLRPVIMVLHGRGGDAQLYCRRFAPIARSLGWLVCPSGPEPRGGGRMWGDWSRGRVVILAALHALRERYGRRVQLRGNTIVGFSEGALVAMNVGLREPRTFNRWLILGASSTYWGPLGYEILKKNARAIRRVYLITGKLDGVHESTLEVRRQLKKGSD